MGLHWGVDGGTGWGEKWKLFERCNPNKRARTTRNSVPQSLTHSEARTERSRAAQTKCLCAPLSKFPCNLMLFRQRRTDCLFAALHWAENRAQVIISFTNNLIYTFSGWHADRSTGWNHLTGYPTRGAGRHARTHFIIHRTESKAFHQALWLIVSHLKRNNYIFHSFMSGDGVPPSNTGL